MFKKYYLAYGSNLNFNQMYNRCPDARVIGSIILNDYRLVYKGESDLYSYLTIEKCKGCSVPLGIFEVSFFDIISLDYYEGCPELYSKHYIPVEINGKNKKALIYIMNKNFDYHLPSIDYIKSCEEGYDDFGFDRLVLDKAYSDTVDNISKRLKRI